METVANNSNATLELGELPGMPEITESDKAALVAKLMAEASAKEETAIARFDATVGFKLEGEVVGKATKRSVSKSGAVTVSVKSKKDLAIVSGLKGGELDAFVRMRKDEVKDKTCQLATRIAGDVNWTGVGVTMSGKGNKITLSFAKVEPMKVTVTPPVSDEVMAEQLGLTVEQVNAMKAAKAKLVAKQKEDEQAAKELADEAAKIAEEASKNGAVHAPSDNDGHAE